MKRLAAIFGILLVALVLLTVVFALLVDPEELRAPILERASLAIGREVELGELDLAFLPPALRAQQIRVAGATAEDPPFAEIGELRLRVSPLPLFAGRVVLRAVALEHLHLRIPLDAQGRPQLPSPAPAPAAPAPEPEPEDGMILAVQQIAISDAVLELGPWRAERVNARGSLALDGSGEIEFSADLPELGTVRNGRVSLAGLGSDAIAADARAEVEVELATLARLLELEQELEGRATGPVSARVVTGALAEARANLQVKGFHARAGEVGLAGDLQVEAVLDESQLLDGRVQLDGNELRVGIALGAANPSIEIRPGRLELAELVPFLEGVPALTGSLEFQSLEVRTEPLQLRGAIALEQVALPVEQGQARITGSLVGRGSELKLEAETFEVAGQPATLEASVELTSGDVSVALATDALDLAALLQELRGRAELSGSLTFRARLSGPPELEAIAGTGSFRLSDGRIQGFSLLRELFGDFATLPVLVASLEGKDLSRYEEEEFESLSADFEIADGRLTTQNLTLSYRNAVAELRGAVGLADGALDLAGRVTLSREVDEELGKSSGRETVIPIAGVTGTVDSPRLRLDRQVLADLALEYAVGSQKVQEELEEAIGEEAAGAVKDLLEGLFRRGR